MIKVYFAHPITDYDTPREERVVNYIQNKLGFEVVNPNSDDSDSAYKEFGMAMFEGMVKSCDMLIYTTFPDQTIGAGVAKEIEWAFENGLPVWEYDYDYQSHINIPDINNIRGCFLSVEETRAKIKQIRDAENEPEPSLVLKFKYLNHEGKVEDRTVTPYDIFFQSNSYYPAEQWLMDAFCEDRNDNRTFALLNILDENGNRVFSRG